MRKEGGGMEAMWFWLWTGPWLLWSKLRQRLEVNEAGEGVVSTSIAVFIMAFLGLALWVAFKAILGHATSNVDQQVSNIGK
jgi:hypothetical protein